MDNLDEIHFNLKKSMKLIRDLTRGLATDRCILVLLFIVVVGRDANRHPMCVSHWPVGRLRHTFPVSDCRACCSVIVSRATMNVCAGTLCAVFRTYPIS